MATHVVLNDAKVLRFTTSPAPKNSEASPAVGSLRKSRGFVEENGCLYVSTRSGLLGAKAALLAFGLEAGMAVVLFGVWQVFRLVR